MSSPRTCPLHIAYEIRPWQLAFRHVNVNLNTTIVNPSHCSVLSVLSLSFRLSEMMSVCRYQFGTGFAFTPYNKQSRLSRLCGRKCCQVSDITLSDFSEINLNAVSPVIRCSKIHVPSPSSGSTTEESGHRNIRILGTPASLPSMRRRCADNV